MSASAKQCAIIHAQTFPAAHAWSETSFEDLLKQPGVECFEHMQSGFLLTRIAADEMEVLTIAVLPGHRRQGIARQLMQHALGKAQQQSCRQCFLEVDVENDAAIALYESLGFTKKAIRENYYQTDHGPRDALVMRLSF